MLNVADVMVSVIRLVSEAVENDGEACMRDGRALRNTDNDVRSYLEMPEMHAHPLVTDPGKDNDAKTELCSVLAKLKQISGNLADMLVGLLCIKVDRIRSLCGLSLIHI